MTACDSTRSNDAGRERQRHAVGPRESADSSQAALAAEPHAGLAEPIDRIDADDLARVLGQRQRHAAAAAAGVEHAAADGDARALEKRDHLGAPVVLEQRVVVLGAEPAVGVRLDEVFSNLAHAIRAASRAGNLSMSTARSAAGVSSTSNVAMTRWRG